MAFVSVTCSCAHHHNLSVQCEPVLALVLANKFSREIPFAASYKNPDEGADRESCIGVYLEEVQS